jgi:hypothetical protein
LVARIDAGCSAHERIMHSVTKLLQEKYRILINFHTFFIRDQFIAGEKQ